MNFIFTAILCKGQILKFYYNFHYINLYHASDENFNMEDGGEYNLHNYQKFIFSNSNVVIGLTKILVFQTMENPIKNVHIS